MLSFFSDSKRSIGIDIKSRYIRFVEVRSSRGIDRVSAYGEVSIDEGVIVDGNILQPAALERHLARVQKALKISRAHVSLPENSRASDYSALLKRVKIKAKKFVPAGQALVQALVPTGSETSFLIVNAVADAVYYALYEQGKPVISYRSDAAGHHVISAINRIYIDWYDARKSRIDHIVFSGDRTREPDFLEYVSRETKLRVHKGNIFANMDISHENVPIITKDDSYKYAVAIGVALS